MTISEFLADMKREFEREDNKIINVAELKRIEQRNRTIKEFVWKLRKVVRRSGYKGKLLIKEFKRGINEVI